MPKKLILCLDGTNNRFKKDNTNVVKLLALLDKRAADQRTPGKRATEACPCGYLGDAAGKCRCTLDRIKRYRAKISGPLLDRLDLHVEVPRVPAEELRSDQPSLDCSAEVAARVYAARKIQVARQGKANAQLNNVEVDRYCAPDTAARIVLERAMQRFSLSGRAYHRILKVARSIADLEGAPSVVTSHVSEAIGLRRLDRAQGGARS